MPDSSPSRLSAVLLTVVLLASGCDAASDPRARLPMVDAGYEHTCSLDADGAAWCWGVNSGGALGDGSTISWLTPHAVSMPAGVTFEDLSAGVGTSCAIDTEGAAWCWGTSWDDPRTTSDDVFVPTRAAVPPDVRFTIISTSFRATCALDTEGAAWCWGRPTDGAPADPTRVSGPDDQVFTDIALGGGYGDPFACALVRDGSAWCWTIGATPRRRFVPEGTTLTLIAAGPWGACGIDPEGGAWCWEGNAAPTRVGPNLRFTSLDVGEGSMCAVSDDGGLWCWGSGAYVLPPRFSRIGGTTDPVAVRTPPSERFATVTMGQMHACAVSTADEVWCWGFNTGFSDEGPGWSPVVPTIVDFGRAPVAAPGALTPATVPWTGEPPIWPLTLEQTEPAFAMVFGQGRTELRDVLLAGGMPARCLEEDPPDGFWGSFDQCELQFLVTQVDDEAAIELLRGSRFTLFERWGAGPVWTAWAWDWDDFGTTGDPNTDVLFTPSGMITSLYGWQPLRDAMAEAYATETFREVEAAASAECFLHTQGDPQAALGAPERQGNGWTVALDVGMYCDVPARARFTLDFSEEGLLEGARFLDFCATEGSSDAGTPGPLDDLQACDPPLHGSARVTR